MHRWYVVQTHPRREDEAERELANQGFETFLPQVMQRSRLGLYLVPFFPGYIFARFDRSSPKWNAINNTRHVIGLLPRKDNPLPVAAAVIDYLKSTADERLILRDAAPLPMLTAGAPVRLIEGPLSDRRGVVLWSEARRVRLLLEMLGRNVELTLPREQVEAV